MRKVKQPKQYPPAGTVEQQQWTDADSEWVEALEWLDYWDKDTHEGAGPKEPLTQLLRSDIELSPLVRSYLADLIERRVSIRSNINKRLPAYHHSISPLNWHHMMTHQQVDIMLAADPLLSLPDAITKAATKEGLDVEALTLSYHGSHNSFRQARKKAFG